LLREATQRSETRDKKQIREAAEEKTEKTVEVARDKPSRSRGFTWLDGAGDEEFLALFKF